MSSFLRIALSFFVLVVAVGCASTEVTDVTKSQIRHIPKPDIIYVFPFAANPADIPSWSNAAEQYEQSSSPQTQDEIEIGRELGTIVAEELVEEINDMGLLAEMGGQQTSPEINNILITGFLRQSKKAALSNVWELVSVPDLQN